MQLRKILNTLLFALIAMCLVFSLVGCGNKKAANNGKEDEQGDPTDEKLYPYTVYLLDAPTTGDWGVWYWLVRKDGTKNEVSKASGDWPVGATSLDKQDKISRYVNFDIENIDDYKEFGCLFVNKDNSQQTEDVLVPISELKEYKNLYFTYANPKVYYTSYDDVIGLMGGTITSVDGNTITIKLSRVTSIDKNAVTVLDSEGNKLTVEDAKVNSATTGTIKVTGGNIKKAPYTIKYDGKTVKAGIDGDLIDEAFVYEGNDLGLTINGSDATFKCWAPLAQNVELLILDSATAKEPSSTIEMTSEEDGVWSAVTTDIPTDGSKYYQYKINNGGTAYAVADIWSYVAGPDSVASQIIDINNASLTAGWEADYVNPFGNSGIVEKLYSDAVIYEMHIRDWSKAFDTNNKGKFNEITDNIEEFTDYLLDLGITHVQILPMFDYAEKNANSAYNWGYNPYHYNVPEGRYVENMENGTDAVTQLRAMIKAFHDAGIAVIMDVVYNHTAGTGVNSLYDMTIPEYFYRIKNDGSYSNGSGCGNEVATNHKMVAKYVIDSLVHWMEDYHINGFRFDLMGCQEQDFMTEVYETLYEIDPNVMVYGEPWTGGTAAVVDGTTETIETSVGNGVGAFEDTFRNGIKGGEFGGVEPGQVQGTYKDTDVIAGLKGLSGRNKNSGIPQLMLSYVECHDNCTLFDKLAIIYLGKKEYNGDLFAAIGAKGLEEVKKQNTLSAAFVFLSQGTPFINGGQEFLRTKRGNHNSYNANDTVNAIDFSFKDTYSDVYNTYKGLIAFRKANSDVFGNNTDVIAEKAKDTSTNKAISGVTKYVVGSDHEFLIYFNATKEDVNINPFIKIKEGKNEITIDYTKVVDVTSGTPTESEELPTSVPAKGFVILAK